jgi:hypothetical protein
MSLELGFCTLTSVVIERLGAYASKGKGKRATHSSSTAIQSKRNALGLRTTLRSDALNQ